MQYSQEYRFADATDCLDSFVSQTAGRFIENLDGIFDSRPEQVQANKNITVPLLAAAVIVLLIDITYRRLDIKPGARIAVAVQGKAAKIKAKAAEGSREKARRRQPQAADNTTAIKTEAVMAQSAQKKEKNSRRERKEDVHDMLDIGSLLAKQKERER